jgi:hypothetical protein
MVFWWLKSLLTAYLPIWVRKTVDNPPAGERARLSAVLRLQKIHIVGGGGLEKNYGRKTFQA